MLTKRNFLFVLCALLVFSTTSSAKMLSKQASFSETSKVFTISHKDGDFDENKSITSINDFAGYVVKGNESNSSAFQNLPNEKKHLVINLALLSTRTFTAFYTTYCQCRINSIQDSPFYIAYHRLTI